VIASVATPIRRSARVIQVESLFDHPPSERSELSWDTSELAAAVERDDWNVGLIVGPSGAGKSTVARAVLGDQLVSGFEWPTDAALLDGFPANMGISEITGLLTSVGLGSTPSWLRPFGVLSNGEQFRATIARALAEAEGVVGVDEFTSVVDRQVAKIASASIAKVVRRANKRFVAVTCHYDVLDWLEPDWTLDMATGQLARVRLRRPELRLDVYRANRSAWPAFARHHYLSGKLAPSARCFTGFLGDTPVAFAAFLPSIGHAGVRRVTRLVVLPDYQGIGLGSRFLAAVCELVRDEGYRVTITTSHPAMIAHLDRSPRWTIRAVKRLGSSPHGGRNRRDKTSRGRAVVSAEFAPGEAEA
jgi:ABC-type ATPase involved in cell division